MSIGVLRALALLAAPAALSGAARASTFGAVLSKSRIVVHVKKRGLLSGMAHDHHFAVRDWRATADFDPANPAEARCEVIAAADSLRDEQPALSSEDRQKVDRQAAGEGVLDARRYPEIRFTSSGPLRGGDGRVEGTFSGTLRLHGRERPVRASAAATREGEAWRVRASVRFKQSDFGIEPYSGFLGTIAVEDEVLVEADLVMVPGG